MDMLVSAMMVTQAGREALAEEAIGDFARQTWPHRELVIITDCIERTHYDRLRRAIEPIERARVVKVPFRETLGYLRNAAVEESSGDVLIQWDDDDRYYMDRISVQMQPILAGAIVTCLTDQLYYFTNTRDLYLVDWRRRLPRSIMIPGTVAIQKDLAAKCSYPERGAEASKGEDGAFLRQAISIARAKAMPAQPGAGLCYLRRWHGNNTWFEGHFRGNAVHMGAKAEHLQEMRLREQLATRVRRFGLPLPVRVMGRDDPAYLVEADKTTLLWSFNSLHGADTVATVGKAS